MRERFRGLWRHPDFLKLWFGQTISIFGSQVTLLALPLAAAVTLDATAAEMGILAAAGSLPPLLFGLFAGVWVDRYRRRPILIATDLGRSVLLATIPLAAALDLLRIELLYVVAFTAGLLTLLFRVAYTSFLPSLISREDLVEGNSRLQVSQSAAQVAGPGIGGTLVQVLTAPIAILLDAVSFFISAVVLMLIRRQEPAPAPPEQPRSVRAEVGEGLRTVLHDPTLRSIGAWAGTFNLFGAVMGAVYILYLTRDLEIRASAVGLILAIGSMSGLISAMLARRVIDSLGVGRGMVGAALLASASQLLVPLAAGPAPVAVSILILAGLLFGIAAPILGINILTLQQAITPDRLLGRVNATMQVLIVGTLPLGALLGGTLGTLIGLRLTLLVGALGIFASVLWIWFSPLRTMQRTPPPPPVAPIAAEMP